MDVLLFTSSVIGELLLLLLVVAVLWEFALEGSARSKAISPSKSSREAKLRYTEAYRR
jgi:hypothetical protein